MIVEDDVGIREMTQKYLESKGYHVIPVECGETALEIISSAQPDLILLDIELPGLNGFEICKKIRKSFVVPIIFLSVRRDTADKVKSFEIGGDDYLTKPFEFSELEARIRANLRRHQSMNDNKLNILKYGELEIHLDKFTCYLNNKLINLSAKEMELLIHLAKNPNQVWSHEQLYEHIWEVNGTSNLNTVKVHISKLRSKLEENQSNPQYIRTIRGFGYKFCHKVHPPQR